MFPESPLKGESKYSLWKSASLHVTFEDGASEPATAEPDEIIREAARKAPGG